ncbi:hypothetical protein E2C01_094629 [Portunus trituberculatus]|uniref:Uncharacterized protein n=1 Tax=Portunus trituberculatus TaxID=210409 RepID=A0A5B7K269_PORTR|nr:hypothetical protein [Portunus trituberculatus]
MRLAELPLSTQEQLVRSMDIPLSTATLAQGGKESADNLCQHDLVYNTRSGLDEQLNKIANDVAELKQMLVSPNGPIGKKFAEMQKQIKKHKLFYSNNVSLRNWINVIVKPGWRCWEFQRKEMDGWILFRRLNI